MATVKRMKEQKDTVITDQIVRASDNIYLITASIPQIGYYARSFTLGKELNMVNDYINKYVISKIKVPQSCKMIVFLEPQIDTGYPDIVIVTYKPSSRIGWDESKKKLSNKHLKVLFEIDRNNRIRISELAKTLGYDEKTMAGYIKDLKNANMVSSNSTYVKRIPYKDYYCIKKTVAIEAKIDKWSDAIEQALHNTRFSDESYILMNKDKCNPNNELKCNELGVGVILLNGKITNRIKPHKNHMPGSYISFLFNNWIIQIDALMGVQ